MAKLTQDEILAYLDEATILELNELVKAIEEKYGLLLQLLLQLLLMQVLLLNQAQ